MSNIDVKRAHGMTQAEALGKLRDLSTALQSRYGIKITLSGNAAAVKGKGVKGTATVDDTHVALNLRLGLPARLVAGKIQAGVDRALDEHFPA
jgi:putative polyhydroxyalkanoate system protein